jgi:hypothetical protein
LEVINRGELIGWQSQLQALGSIAFGHRSPRVRSMVRAGAPPGPRTRSGFATMRPIPMPAMTYFEQIDTTLLLVFGRVSGLE